MDLSAGETELFHDRPSWRSLLSHYVIGTIIALVGGAIAWKAKSVGLGVAVFAVIFVVVVLVGLLRRLSTRYVITNERLHIRRGVFAREIQQTRLERVQDMAVKQSFGERMLRIGTVDFDTAGGDKDEDFAFRGVSHPERVMTEVDKAIRSANQPAAAAPAPAAYAPPPAAAPPAAAE
jgi:uncharacterized membrane protein YdbT with pleckstrin-like domain